MASEIEALVDRVLDGVIADGVAGLSDWGAYAENQARHYAPVRRVFYGSRSSEIEFTRGGSAAQGTSPGSVRSRPVYIRTDAAMQLYKASRRRQRRVLIPGESRLGEANSYSPVFSRGSRRVTGLNDTFRRVSRTKSGQARLARIEAIQTQPGQEPRRFLAPRVLNRREAIRSPDERFSARSELNFRGRYELSEKAARLDALYRDTGGEHGRLSAIYKDARGRETLGGRLRGEIRLTRPMRSGNVYWVYVESPTFYGRYQEFGTRHNRAQPYLRPALYDASKRTSIVRRAITAGRRI